MANREVTSVLRDQIAEAQAEVEERQAHLDALRGALDVIEKGGKPKHARRAGRKPGRKPTQKGKRGPGRPKGSTSKGAKQEISRSRGDSLKTHIASVLREAGRPMEIKEITDAVLKNGFQTKNKSLAKTVSLTMKDIDEAKRVGRGTYEYKA